MRKLIILFFFISSSSIADLICKKDNLKYPDEVPLDFRWHESDFNSKAARQAIDYLAKIVDGDLSAYHWIRHSNSEMIINGYTYKLLAMQELSFKNVKHPYHVRNFCDWVSNTTRAD